MAGLVTLAQPAIIVSGTALVADGPADSGHAKVLLRRRKSGTRTHYDALVDSLVRAVVFWAHARWATPAGRLTDFSFSSILWEQ